MRRDEMSVWYKTGNGRDRKEREGKEFAEKGDKLDGPRSN